MTTDTTFTGSGASTHGRRPQAVSHRRMRRSPSCPASCRLTSLRNLTARSQRVRSREQARSPCRTLATCRTLRGPSSASPAGPARKAWDRRAGAAADLPGRGSADAEPRLFLSGALRRCQHPRATSAGRSIEIWRDELLAYDGTGGVSNGRMISEQEPAPRPRKRQSDDSDEKPTEIK
jgi:hypothetical protein